MNIEKIIAIYELSKEKVQKTLKAAGLDHNAADFTRDDLKLFDEALELVSQGKSYKQAADIIKKRSQPSMPMELDPAFQAVLDQQADRISQQYAGSSPEVIKQQQELANQYLVNRFWDNMRQMAESGELAANFDRVLGANNNSVIEAQVLPGESPALPENSSSAT